MKTKKTFIEWVFFAVSVVLLLGVVGILVMETLQRETMPPDLRIELGRAERVATGYRVHVRVRNEGATTAEEAKVEVRLESQGREVESAELTLRFVPSKSNREGWVVFRHDPSCCEMTAVPVGFEMP